VRCKGDLAAGIAQKLAQGFADASIVVGEQHARATRQRRFLRRILFRRGFRDVAFHGDGPSLFGVRFIVL